MSDIAILDQMIKNSARIPVEVDAFTTKKFVKLTEPQEPTSVVTIHNVPDDAVVIKVDKFEVDKVFNGSKDECKRADYVIISDSCGKKRILYIEMKKTKDSEKQIISQLKGATCFVAYCKEIASVFWEKRDLLSGFQERFVSFGHTGGINKKRTRIERPTRDHNTPERLMKISWPSRTEFNNLVGA
ncbi:MAG: hypothetical protein KGZ62_06205 [Sulfurimonas sp.]|nr:hypothetical protein [Sulfurimonas sp.]